MADRERFGFSLADRAQAGAELPEQLRAEVHLLGELLGRILVESGGPGLLHDVERLRAATIAAYGAAELGSIAEAEAIVDSFSAERAEEVARAFTCYFHLANLAEEHHRARVLRSRDSADAPGTAAALEDSLPAAIARLREELGEQEAARRLAALEFRPVFTAHPTEARRRAVAASIRRISELMHEREDPRTGGRALEENTRRLLAEIDVLWRTAPLRQQRPTPQDEVRTVMTVFDETLFGLVPAVYRRLDNWLHGGTEAGAGRAAPLAPDFLRFGSWIGGDRDGNPFVTAEVTLEAARIAAEHVLLGLERATRRIGRALTVAEATAPSTDALLALWAEHAARLGPLAEAIATRAPGEPYRRVLLAIAERIAATRTGQDSSRYSGPEELLRELTVVQDSLRAGGAAREAYGEVQSLIWQLRTFGFHLAELEVRQHSKVHAAALENARAGRLDEPQTAEVLAVFRAIRALQDRYGPLAARRYIVSFTRSAEDLANVYELARLAAGPDDEPPVLDVIPLFETFDDLQASTRILDELLEHPVVRRRLEETGRRVEVMLGYSDSSKDVGPVAATLALYDAQARIARWAQEHDIVLTLFHGRGGALGRGGGPANKAVLAQPPGSVDGRFKVTEQGEVIFARYADAEIAARHIEQVAAATLMASAPSNEQRTAAAAEEFAGLAARLDEVSRHRYRALVDAPGFAAWFAQVTPQEEIGLLALGSRPARRGLSLESLEDLRAIPWVFSWTQARINLTGWYGLGSALAAVDDTGLLRAAYARWPLFSTMIDNVEMSLAKTDPRIARRYLELGDRDELREAVLEELRLTREGVLRTTGAEEILERKRVLRRAVQLRSPYVDALSLIQLRALRALRSGTAADVDAAQRLLLLSVNGVAAGLQNTG